MRRRNAESQWRGNYPVSTRIKEGEENSPDPRLLDEDQEDDSFFNEMKWVKPAYGPGRVDAAGKIIAGRRQATAMTMDDALSIAANWRSSHGYPLKTFSSILRHRAKSVDPEALVVQRLKRMPSMSSKLKRFERMQLSQMQDLGGCRAIVATIKEVNELVALYENIPLRTAKFYGKHDYISQPKADGYRGIHLIYEYQSADNQRSIYNGKRIEVQIRSRAQHAWATAVETIDTFTQQSLKSGLGTESWKRFFALMSSFLSSWERDDAQFGSVPNTPFDIYDVSCELNTLIGQLKVVEILTHLVTATEAIYESSPSKMVEMESYILFLNLATEEIRIFGFPDNVEASVKYIELEKEHIGDSSVQLVLASGESISALMKGYPNYFLDSAKFVGYVEAIRDTWNDVKNSRELNALAGKSEAP